MNRFFLAAAILAASVAPSAAALQVVLDVGGSTETIADNSVNDTNSALNTIDVSDVVFDGVTFNGVATFLSTPHDEVQVSGLMFDNDTAATVLASFTASESVSKLSLGVDATVPAFGTVIDRGVEDISAVPEPSTWAMLAVGFGLLGGVASWRRSAGLRLTPSV